jgi:adenylyl cyclase-associated protein
MTHKNPDLRTSAVVPAVGNGKKPVKPSKPASLMSKRPSKFALEGSKWLVVRTRVYDCLPKTNSGFKEFHENESGLVIENAELNHVVNIFGCKNSTIQVKGKVNAVSLGTLVLLIQIMDAESDADIN